MLIRIMVLLACAVLPAQAMEFGIGGVGNIGMGLSRDEIEIRDPNANVLSDHLSSREPVFGLGPMVNMWFSDFAGFDLCLQYCWHTYNYTYDYTSSEGAIESRLSIQSLLLPTDLKIAIPYGGKNRAFLGGGIIAYKQLRGKEGGIYFGDDIGERNIPSEELKTAILPRAIIGTEFLYSGDIGFHIFIDYYRGMDAYVYTGPSVSTYHLNINLAILFYPGKNKNLE
jgi:hypothetical protein